MERNFRFSRKNHRGGAEGNRTPDLLIANEALSHLSYSPTVHAINIRPLSLVNTKLSHRGFRYGYVVPI